MFGWFVGDAFLATRHHEKFRILDHTFLEAELGFSGGIGFDRGGLVEQSAKVVKMLLIGGGFLARELRPLGLELCPVHSFPAVRCSVGS